MRRITGVAGVAAAVLAAGALALAGSAPAYAATVVTPIGTVGAEQYQGAYCDDFGADVLVTVTGGRPSTTYTAHATGFGTGPVAFTTDAAGAGSVRVHNVTTPSGSGIGTATVLVSASPYTTAVTAEINCPGNKGD
ncbi:hypothetical protein Val02_08380 [Virgisporangium aliadipatigenens]|uniref:Uncharacterized protein n=1 Tax=Virgisporangium aliadipatigenens TaxID=741659 RepID=A0A8J3YGG1_9ACTN|nr:hypothetical protein [Virgisporangium aliadipatigenens]GIJ43952.1 hypothetical protein Val02_08380 [Virgisporangium aliadipatigenens]